ASSRGGSPRSSSSRASPPSTISRGWPNNLTSKTSTTRPMWSTHPCGRPSNGARPVPLPGSAGPGTEGSSRQHERVLPGLQGPVSEPPPDADVPSPVPLFLQALRQGPGGPPVQDAGGRPQDARGTGQDAPFRTGQRTRRAGPYP